MLERFLIRTADKSINLLKDYIYIYIYYGNLNEEIQKVTLIHN